jgi:FPC/CPF motif-containing protein YcgG
MSAIPANSSFTFMGYKVTDDGVIMTFTCLAPGAGNNTDDQILATFAELASVATAQDLRNLVTTKLQQKIRATGVASKLDSFIGQSLTI